ncbi:acyl-CoA N-acyltransferase [Mycena alexandri]|uniref:Acyl-CoA N-acyltransferase n=1 Tax=Mycena alexandri TaxID=1745969 RepID=A0AAD6T1A3_9AGAR|nr:acyl-CoA N-acyltransferase [Mycena alexandri]
MAIKIRPASAHDAPALSRICLLTADAGQTAEHLHDFPELPGLVWAVPYVNLPTTWGFVMEEDSGDIVGYIVPADQHYTQLLRKMRVLPETTLAFAPAHLHIDILGSHQKQGWGRKLIETAVEYLRCEGVDGVWLVMNPKNVNARKFYERLGFRSIEGSPENHVGLKFDSWAC